VLLRTAVAALRAAGHSVSLLAPLASGIALRGGGPAEVDAVLDLDSPAMSPFFADEADPASEAAHAVRAFEAIVAFTSNAELLRALGASGARVIARPPKPPDEGPHAARWLADAVAELGGRPEAAPPLLRATPDETHVVATLRTRLPPRFLAVHPGSGARRKNWPADRFAALVRALSPDRPWLLVVGPAETEVSERLGRLPFAVPVFERGVRIVGGVLGQAGLYVGNDSGVSHLAAAFGAPTLALFGPTDPALWAPVGPRVTVLRSPDGAMTGLPLEDVLAAARKIDRLT
jgi:heptosyltransferase-2